MITLQTRFVLLLICSTSAIDFSRCFAATFEWNNKVGKGQWSDSSNWIINDPKRKDFPGKGDSVTIRATGSIPISIQLPDQDILELASLTVDGVGYTSLKGNLKHRLTMAKAEIGQIIFEDCFVKFAGACNLNDTYQFIGSSIEFDGATIVHEPKTLDRNCELRESSWLIHGQMNFCGGTLLMDEHSRLDIVTLSMVLESAVKNASLSVNGFGHIGGRETATRKQPIITLCSKSLVNFNVPISCGDPDNKFHLVGDVQIAGDVTFERGVVRIITGSMGRGEITATAKLTGNDMYLSGNFMFENGCTVTPKRAYLNELGGSCGEIIFSKGAKLSVGP